MADQEQTTEALNDLLQKNLDAQRGYKKASRVVEHTSLEAYLRKKSDQRKDFSDQIKSEIVSLGGEPAPSTTITGSLHRTWIDLKTIFASNTDEAVFEECVRGEKYCLKEYDSKLQEVKFPASSRSLLIAQRNRLETDLEKTKNLEALTGY